MITGKEKAVKGRKGERMWVRVEKGTRHEVSGEQGGERGRDEETTGTRKTNAYSMLTLPSLCSDTEHASMNN